MEEKNDKCRQKEIFRQIDLMTAYAQMMLDRKDYHGLWDAAIDLQRLSDRLKEIDIPILTYEYHKK